MPIDYQDAPKLKTTATTFVLSQETMRDLEAIARERNLSVEDVLKRAIALVSVAHDAEKDHKDLTIAGETVHVFAKAPAG